MYLILSKNLVDQTQWLKACKQKNLKSKEELKYLKIMSYDEIITNNENKIKKMYNSEKNIILLIL